MVHKTGDGTCSCQIISNGTATIHRTVESTAQIFPLFPDIISYHIGRETHTHSLSHLHSIYSTVSRIRLHAPSLSLSLYWGLTATRSTLVGWTIKEKKAHNSLTFLSLDFLGERKLSDSDWPRESFTLFSFSRSRTNKIEGFFISLLPLKGMNGSTFVD